jgi:hypothetical protein
MSYRVIFAEAMEKRRDELALQAVQHAQDLPAAARRMVARIEEDPFVCGECLYHYSNSEPAHHYIESPLSMWFAIYVAHRHVWVYRLDRLPASDE